MTLQDLTFSLQVRHDRLLIGAAAAGVKPVLCDSYPCVPGAQADVHAPIAWSDCITAFAPVSTHLRR